MNFSERLFPAGTGPAVWLLLDPDSTAPERLGALAAEGEAAGATIILVGGSFIAHDGFDAAVRTIKKRVGCPVVIFPGGSGQVCRYADGILFMSLLSGRNPQYLIGEQVKAAPLIRQFSLPHLPTAYLLVESGTVTSAEYISDTKPIPRDKPKLAAAHAIAAELFGMQAVYLEAGSGAKLPVPPEMVRMVTASVGIPVIVGGGITNSESALAAARAGARAVVVGTAVERSGINVVSAISQAFKRLDD